MQNIESIIIRFLQNNTTPDDDEFLYQWLKENPNNRKFFFHQKDLWDSSLIGSQHLTQVELEEWLKFQERISKQKFIKGSLKEIFRIAAIVIIATGVGWLGHYLFSSYKFSMREIEMKQVEALNGQVKEIFLADGTHIWLNSGSSIKFPSIFNAENREVELRGEAFFEVTASEDKSFLVKTISHKVKVTGTRFNVCEYPENNIIETTLEEGKVKIITGNIIKDLIPGQKSSFNTETAQIRISPADMDVYTSWKEGYYSFNNESLCKVFDIIERWWDTEIVYPEEALRNERVTGVLRKYKSLEFHFEVLSKLIPIDYIIEPDLITVTIK